MENPRNLNDSVEKVTITGDEMLIGLDGREIKIKLSVLKTYLGIAATGNVVPAKVPGLDLGAPADAKFYVGGPGTYTLNGVAEQYSDVVNFFFWDKISWDVLEIPIEVSADGQIAPDDTRPISGNEAFLKTITKANTQKDIKPFSFVDPVHVLDVRNIVKDITVEISTYNQSSLYKPDGQLRRFQIFNINPSVNRVYIGRENDSGVMAEYATIDIASSGGFVQKEGMRISIKTNTLQNYSSSSYAGFSPNLINEVVFINAINNYNNYVNLSIKAPSPLDSATDNYTNILSENGVYPTGTKVIDSIVIETKDITKSGKLENVLGVFKEIFKYPTRIGKGLYTYQSIPKGILNEIRTARAIQSVKIVNGDRDAIYKVSWFNINLVSLGFTFYISKIKDNVVTNFILNSSALPDLSGVKTFTASSGNEVVTASVDIDIAKEPNPYSPTQSYYLSPDNTSNGRIFSEGNLILSGFVIISNPPESHILDNLATDRKILGDVILGEYGAANALYKFPLNTPNNIFRIKFEVKFNESMNLSNGRKDVMNIVKGTQVLGILGYSSSNVANSIYQQSNSLGTGIVNQVIDSVAGLGYHNVTDVYKLTTRKYPFYKPLYGEDAMFLRYKYDGAVNSFTDVCLSISTTELRIYRSTDNSTLATFSITEYSKVYDLVQAIKELPYMDADFLDNVDTSELIKCTGIKLVSEYFAGESASTPEPFFDAAKLYIPTAIDKSWHTVEVVSNGTAIFVVWDGVAQKVISQVPSDFNGGDIYIGGNNASIVVNNQIRNLEINFGNTGDAEVFERKLNGNPTDVPIVVSNMHPHIKAYMAHSIHDVRDADTPTSSSVNISTDRLEQMFRKLIDKGYVPITVKDIADFYANKKDLPKRCFTIIWDDYRYQNWVNFKFRSLQLKYGVRACWAWITDENGTITDSNGNIIEKPRFLQSLKDGGMDVESHTKDHRNIYRGLQSELDQEFQADILSAINNGVGSDIMIYPFGGINPNVVKSAEHNFRSSYHIPYTGRYLTKASTKAAIIRERCEVGVPISNVLDNII